MLEEHVYVERETIKAALDIEDTTDDNAIALALNAASRAIDAYCGRRFYSESTTRYFTADDPNYCEIDDLVSITSLKTDDDDDGVYENTWSADDYQLLPINPTVKTTIRVRSGGGYSFLRNKIGAVAVEGVFGKVVADGDDWKAPHNVQQACQILAIRLMKRKDAPFGVAGTNDFGQVTMLSEFDRDVKMLIDSEVRII